MKLLAILKDSFRETLDARVFSILLALSVGVIILFASLSFTPKPNADLRFTLQETLNRDDGTGPRSGRVLWVVRGIQFVDGPADHPATPLRLTVAARHPTAAAAAEVRDDIASARTHFEERLGRLEHWRLLRVTDVRPAATDNPFITPPPDPRDVILEVDARPTAKMRLVWPHECYLFFGLIPMDPFWRFALQHPETPPLGRQLWFLEDQIVNGPLCWGALVVSVVVTAFFIPNMMQKGRLDLLLVKPISRVGLLVYKYLGGLLFILLSAAFAVGGVWLVLGIRSGVWDPTVLLVVLIVAFFFAILYSVSTLVGVLTRSGAVAIVAVCFVWILLFAVGRAYTTLYDNAEKLQRHDPMAFEAPDWALPVATALHHVLPRTDDLNPLVTRLLSESLMTPEEVRGFDLGTRAVNWPESIGVSVGFIVVFLGLACWRFAAGDY